MKPGHQQGEATPRQNIQDDITKDQEKVETLIAYPEICQNPPEVNHEMFIKPRQHLMDHRVSTQSHLQSRAFRHLRLKIL